MKSTATDGEWTASTGVWAIQVAQGQADWAIAMRLLEAGRGRIDISKSTIAAAPPPVSGGMAFARSAVEVRCYWWIKTAPEAQDKSHVRHFLTSLDPDEKQRNPAAVRGRRNLTTKDPAPVFGASTSRRILR